MKQILLFLFLFLYFSFVPVIYAAVSFVISNPVREGDYFIVDASVSGISSSSAFVQGMFTSTNGSTNYFGFTWGQNEEWVNYVGSTNKDFIIQNLPILQRNVSQKIWVKPNYQDSAYKGPGEYKLILKRYTGASDNATGSEAGILVTLTEPLPTPSQTPTEEPTNTPEPTSAWTPNPTKTPTPTPSKSITQKPSISVTSGASSSASISAVLGTSTDSSSLSIENSSTQQSSSSKIRKAVNYKLFFFIGLCLAAVASALLYFRHRTD